MQTLTNLLVETLLVLRHEGLSPSDVHRVQAGGDVCTWAEFEKLARTVDYDAGYGSQKICSDLKIVGTDWWLERHEYDGAEGWSFKRLPSRPRKPRPLRILLESDRWNLDDA